MANSLKVNPIYLDTTGATSAIAKSLAIASIIVIASADNWSCIIHDKASGNVVFRADSVIANHRSVYWSPARPQSVDGIYFTTGTNITCVLVYCSSVSGL